MSIFNPGCSKAEFISKTPSNQYGRGIDPNDLPSVKPSGKSCYYCGMTIPIREVSQALNLSRFTSPVLSKREEVLVEPKCAHKALKKLGLDIQPKTPTELILALFKEHEEVRTASKEDDLQRHHLIMNVCSMLTGNETAYAAGKNLL